MTTDPTHGLSVPHADALWDAIAAPGPRSTTFLEQHERVCAAVADIISEVTAGQPPADRADLRDRIAEALMQWAEGNNSPKYAAVRRPETVVQNAYSRADAVLAVLPTPTDRAAVLREAADEIAGIDFHPNARARSLEIAAGLACRLRRMADEAPQDPTPTDRAAVLLEAADKLDGLTQETAGADMTMPEGRWQAGLDAGIRELRRLAGEAPQDPTQDGPTPCGGPVPCEDGGERCDRHEREQAHAKGVHELCGIECEETLPSEQLRNAILCRAIPGSKAMLAELERRAAVAPQDGPVCAHPHGRPGLASLLEHVGIDTSNGVTVDGRTVAAPCTCAAAGEAFRPAGHYRDCPEYTRETPQDPTQDGTLTAALDGLHTLIATSSRDWGVYRVDAWLWAVLCGWDCEQDEHDETCTHGALEEMAELHGWDADIVAKARRYRAAVRALTEPAAAVASGQPDTDGETPQDEVQP